jgi:lactate dehydrogenase-like 2-hydroxyacid dehydrogenase
MLAICHRTAELDRRMRQPNSDIEFGVMNNLGIAIYGKTLGIIGMGNIGQSIAGRAVACGMKIIYNNRRRLPEEIERRYNAEYVDLETLLRTSDFVSLNLPYTPDSHHIINEDTLSMMKQGAVLINTARGAHIDEAALVRHLRSGHLYGAALDVYEFEPHVTPELLELDNVVLSPHIGTGTIDGRIAMCHCCCDNINWFLHGEHHKMNRVN